MASLDGASAPLDDFSANVLAFPDFTTPPFYQSIYPLLYAPLSLPRDEPDAYFSPLVPFGDPFDFQSNHLENTRPAIDILHSPLSGLGIQNIEFSRDKDTEVQDIRLPRTDGWLGPQSHERRTVYRNHRTDSVYEMPEQQTGGLPAALGSPWVFSGILEAAELAVEQDLEINSSRRSVLNLSESSDPFSSNSAQDVSSAFEKISASTGMSVADFAAQVSATAEETLRRMSADKLTTPSHYRPYEDYGRESNTWAARLGPFSPPGLLASRLSSWNSDCVGVNPADIYSVPAPSNPAPRRIFIAPPDKIAPTFKTGKECPMNDQPGTPDLETHSQPGTLGSPYEEAPTVSKSRSSSKDVPQKSDDELSIFQSPSSSEYSPSVQPLSLKRNASSRINTRRTTRKVEDSDAAYTEYQDADQYNHLPVNLGTPVFDAHRGIDIEELKAKAERYRLRNQGRDYDKRWLISFAGKLSAKGELVEEFRCYVSGCKQNNKRRDHILIHVGAHLDQRPFKCAHCSARFLRKNECKRHELSHTGIRPFACSLCPSPTTTFVRQDLLKRHMKRTHHIDFKADKENEDNGRPRKRARH